MYPVTSARYLKESPNRAMRGNLPLPSLVAACMAYFDSSAMLKEKREM